MKEYSTRRHSTAEPQPKEKRYHSGAHEEHEGKYFFKIGCPLRYPIFVSLAFLSLKVFAARRKSFRLPKRINGNYSRQDAKYAK